MHTAVASEILMLINSVSGILHANDVNFEFLNDLIHEWLRQRNILAISVKMYHNFFGLAFEEQARNKVFASLLFGGLLRSHQPLFFIHQFPLRLKLSLFWRSNTNSGLRGRYCVGGSITPFGLLERIHIRL